MGDDPVALVGQEYHLRFPAVRIQRPAVAEGDDRAILGTPILVIQLYAVSGGDGASCVFDHRGGLSGLCGSSVGGHGDHAGGKRASKYVHD
ncbi:hypothetical protein D3C81_2031580 [compost metagenome]